MPTSSASTIAGMVMSFATYGAPSTAITATTADSSTPGASRRSVVASAGAGVAEASAMRDSPSLRAAIELGERVFAVTQRLGRGEAAVGSADHHVDQRVAGLRD